MNDEKPLTAQERYDRTKRILRDETLSDAEALRRLRMPEAAHERTLKRVLGPVRMARKETPAL